MNFLVLFLTILGFTRGLRAGMVAAGQSGVSEGRGRGAVQLPGPCVSQTAFPRGPRRAGEGMGLHLLGLCLPPPKLAEHWELSRCDPGRCHGVIPAVLRSSHPEPRGPWRSTATETLPGAGSDPTAPPARAPEDPARLVTERCPESAAKAGRGPVSARGGRFPRPEEKMRRR